MNFLCQQGSHKSMIYCKISIFVFFNLLNQFLAILGGPTAFLTATYIFIYLFIIIIYLICFRLLLFVFFSFFVWGPKNW
jgi:hypothetical protein